MRPPLTGEHARSDTGPRPLRHWTQHDPGAPLSGTRPAATQAAGLRHAQPRNSAMTSVHVVPTDEPPERHTLGECPCRPRRRPRRRADGTIIDWVLAHRAADDEPRPY